MKKVIAIFLIVTLTVQYFNKVGIFVYYELNKNYISSYLCENINNPEKACHGQCFMNKQLKASNENQNKLPITLKSVQEIIFFLSDKSVLLEKPVFSKNIQPVKLVYALISQPCARVFQPPKSVFI